MPQETIENPIINSAFRPPSKHFKFSDDGITNIIEDGQRPSAYFTGAEEPYDKLKRALRAEIDETAWASLYRTESQPFNRPEPGR